MNGALTFVGTASALVEPGRFHTSFLVETREGTLLVEAGDGTARALNSQGRAPSEIDAIAISHHHADHSGGLTALVTQMSMADRATPLSIFTHEEDVGAVRDSLRRSYMLEESLGFAIEVVGFRHDALVRVFDDLSFTPRRSSHLDRYLRATDEPLGDISYHAASFRFALGDRNVVYTGDVASREDLLLFADAPIDAMICEAAHVGAADIIATLAEARPGRLLLVHWSLADRREVLGRLLDENVPAVEFAADGQTIFL